jgi:hypothetical protein
MDFGFQNGGSSGGDVPSTLNYGLFTQTQNSATVVNTTAESTLIGNGYGTLTVPSGTFRDGDTFYLKMSGIIGSKNNKTLTIRLHANGIDIASTGAMILQNSLNKNWELSCCFVIRALAFDGTAELSTAGNFSYIANASTSFEAFNFNVITNVVNINVDNTLDVVCEWGEADVLNNILSTQVILTKLF